MNLWNNSSHNTGVIHINYVLHMHLYFVLCLTHVPVFCMYVTLEYICISVLYIDIYNTSNSNINVYIFKWITYNHYANIEYNRVYKKNCTHTFLAYFSEIIKDRDVKF